MAWTDGELERGQQIEHGKRMRGRRVPVLESGGDGYSCGGGGFSRGGRNN